MQEVKGKKGCHICQLQHLYNSSKQQDLDWYMFYPPPPPPPPPFQPSLHCPKPLQQTKFAYSDFNTTTSFALVGNWWLAGWHCRTPLLSFFLYMLMSIVLVNVLWCVCVCLFCCCCSAASCLMHEGKMTVLSYQNLLRTRVNYVCSQEGE